MASGQVTAVDTPLTGGGGTAPGTRRTRSGHDRGLVRRILLRPETTAVAGTIAAFLFFALIAGSSGFLTQLGTINYLSVAATVGILAVPVTLLLVAGEFDLSIGAAVGATGVLISYLVVVQGWPLWLGLVAGLLTAGAIGLINGLLIAFTGIPSFLVTLAMMFGLQGLAVALTKQATGQTSVNGLNTAAADDPLLALFTGSLFGLPAEVLWWIGLTLLGAFLLAKTKFGNWIYVCGGNADAGARMGVPVRLTKILLYVATACTAVIVGVLFTAQVNQADATNGVGMEFEAAVVTVIGGALITGGYGSPLGTFFGALLFGMVSQGFFYTDIDGAYFLTFLGVMLLAAVGVNLYLKTASMRARIKE